MAPLPVGDLPSPLRGFKNGDAATRGWRPGLYAAALAGLESGSSGREFALMKLRPRHVYNGEITGRFTNSTGDSPEES